MKLPPLDWQTAYEAANWAIRIGAIVVVPFKRRFTAAAWLLLLFFLPIPGLILFLLIGQPKFPKARVERFRTTVQPFFERVAKALAADRKRRPSPVERLARRAGGLPSVDGNSVELLDDYDATIRRLIADIDGAKERVFILAYIFADDSIGCSVIDALGRAVGRGVDCRVLIDPVGSTKWIHGTHKRLREAGVHIRDALPWRWIRGATRRDMRNHRKLFIVDGRIGYAGSQNIVCKDFKPGVVNRELVARCTGPIVAEMEALFLGDWCLETGDEPEQSSAPAATGDALLQLLPSGAEYALEGFETLLVWQLHEARERAVLVTPYFIPDEDVLGAMRTAAARGVEVNLVLSKVVDHRLVNLAQRSYYDGLLRSGVRIYLYDYYLLHAKNVGIDSKLAIVGSSNVDVRSFQLNEEVSLLLLDQRSAAALDALQRGYLEGSTRLQLDEWQNRSRAMMVLENLARLISPLL